MLKPSATHTATVVEHMIEHFRQGKAQRCQDPNVANIWEKAIHKFFIK